MTPLKTRRGFGLVIALALFIAMILSLSSLSLGKLGSGVRVDVIAGQQVTRARFVAQAALEELAFRIAAAANDPASTGVAKTVYTLFRQGAFDAQGGPIDVIPDLAHARSWLKSFQDPTNPLATSPDISLTGVVARILHTRYFRSTRPPWHCDLYGTLGLEAHVAIKRAHETTSEIMADRWLEFKVVQTGITPPFDQFTLTMFQPRPWVNAHARYSSTDPREDTDSLLLTILQHDIPEARFQITNLKSNLAKLAGVLPAALKQEMQGGIQDAQTLLAANDPLITYWLSGPPPIADHRFFPSPHLRYLLPGDVKLDELNLPAYLLATAPQRLSLDSQTNKLRDQLNQAVNASNISQIESIAPPLRQASYGQLKVDMEILATLRRINEAFVKRIGRAELESFEPHRLVLAAGFDAQAVTTPAGTAISAGRITHVVDRPGVKDRLLKLLGSFGQPFNGIIEVRNSGEELVLSAADAPVLGAFTGHATIVVQGDLTLSDFRVIRSGGKSGGVVCFVCGGNLRARGQIDASLVALSNFEATGPLVVKGSLLLDQACFQSGLPPERLINDVQIQDDPLIRCLDPTNPASVLPWSYRVLFGPHPIYETSLRQPATRPGP